MRDVLSIALTGLILASLAGCSKAPQPIASSETLQQAQLQYYWTCDLHLAKSEDIKAVKLLDEHIYLFTDQGNLIAVRADNGVVRWVVNVVRPGQTVYAPCHVDGLAIPQKAPSVAEFDDHDDPDLVKPFNALLANTLSEIIILNRNTGSIYRTIRMSLGAAAGQAGVANNKHFFVPDDRGWYHAILLREGVKEWSDITDGQIVAPLILENKRFYVTSVKGEVSAVSTQLTRKKLWTHKLDGPVSCAVKPDNDSCYVACEDGRLYGFRNDNGHELWPSFDCKADLTVSPQLAGTTILQATDHGKTFAVDAKTGQMKWSHDKSLKVAAVNGESLFVADEVNNLVKLETESGKVQAVIPGDGYKYIAANEKTDSIYILGHDFKLYCLRQKDGGKLTAEDIKR